jgi:hypothetical protein
VFELQQPPDYYGQFMAPLQRQQQIGIMQQNADAQTAEAQAQAIKLAQGMAQLRAYQRDASSVISNPSPEGYRALMLKYPEMHDSLKNAWDSYGEGQRQRDTEAASKVYAALSSGRTDLALQLVKDRKTALAGTGADTKTEDALIDMIESGDPAKIKQAQGMAGFALASAIGPDKIGPTLEALSNYSGTGDSSKVVGRAIGHYENGKFVVDYRDPDAPQYRELEVTGPDGQTHKAFVAVGGTGSGTPAASGGASGGFDNAVGFVLKHEGGYNPSDMNGAPVNFGINQKANPGVDVKGLTEDSAKGIYKSKYWDESGAENLPSQMQTPYFDTYIINPARAKQFLKASGGDVNKFMDLRETWMNSVAARNPKYKKAYDNRNADLRELIADGGTAAPGQPNVVAMGAPGGSGNSFRMLTPDEAKEKGLDPNIKYQINSNGQITALGGQNRQSKQIPQTVLNKAQPIVDVRDTLNRLTANWNDDFGGHVILGDNLNKLQRTLGGLSGAPQGMANWWADFQSMDNIVRNQLFGSALTEHEKQAYAATTVSPRMAPEEIRKNLNRRLEIIRAAAARQQNFLKKNGYDPEAVDALFEPLGDFGNGVGPSAAPVRVRSVQEAQKLPSGTLFVTPDGRTMRKK